MPNIPQYKRQNVNLDFSHSVRFVSSASREAASVASKQTSSKMGRFLRYFVRDKGRFPPSGGYTVTPGPDYTIALQAAKADGTPLPRRTWGPYAIAPRAIIDLEMKV
jgi:hypothetical protein